MESWNQHLFGLVAGYLDYKSLRRWCCVDANVALYAERELTIKSLAQNEDYNQSLPMNQINEIKDATALLSNFRQCVFSPVNSIERDVGKELVPKLTEFVCDPRQEPWCKLLVMISESPDIVRLLVDKCPMNDESVFCMCVNLNLNAWRGSRPSTLELLKLVVTARKFTHFINGAISDKRASMNYYSFLLISSAARSLLDHDPLVSRDVFRLALFQILHEVHPNNSRSIIHWKSVGIKQIMEALTDGNYLGEFDPLDVEGIQKHLARPRGHVPQERKEELPQCVPVERGTRDNDRCIVQ